MLGVLFLLSAATSYVITRVSIHVSLRRRVLDLPSARSSHSEPVPRLGGMGILCGLYLPVLGLWLVEHLGFAEHAIGSREVMVVLGCVAGMAATGLWDDLHTLRPATKLVMQLLWAALAVGFGMRVDSVSVPFTGVVMLGALSWIVTILWLPGFSNVYNFMDGINGLAAGTGMIYGGFFFLLARREGDTELMVLAILSAGSCLGFLVHNFPAARTFMGDIGSLSLGMLFALFVVRLAQRSPHASTFVALVLVCVVFLYDAAFTILRRIRRRENIFQAHRGHLYQRLAQTGLTHARITGLYLLLHGLVGVLALAYVAASDAIRAGILGLVVLILLVFTFGVSRAERRVTRSGAVRGVETPGPGG